MRIKFQYDNPERIRQGMEPVEGMGSVNVLVAPQSEAVRGEMAEYEADRQSNLRSGFLEYYSGRKNLLIYGTEDEVIAALEGRILARQREEEKKQELAVREQEAVAKKLAEETAAVETWIEGPMADRLICKYGEWVAWKIGCDIPKLRTAYDQAEAEAKIEAGKRNEAAMAEREAEKAKKEQAEAARQAAVLTMLREHGTASQVERYKVGVLPESEIKAIVRKLLMGALNDAGFDRYEPIGDAVEHAEYCPENGCNAQYTEDPLETLSANQWANLKHARKLAPDCTVTAVLHRAWAGCNETVETTRPALLVEGEMHGIKVSRNYGLTDEPIPENLITDAENQEARR